MNDWVIGLSTWIIADGNFKEFFKGQIVDFGLELYSEGLSLSNSTVKSAEYLDGCDYQVVGEVISVGHNVITLDFGVKGFMQLKTTSDYPQVNQYLEGKVRMLIDPFFIKEKRLKLLQQYPKIYRWQVNQLDKKVIPLVFEKNPKGIYIGKHVYSEAKKSIVSQTNTKGDEVETYYDLHCTNLGIAEQSL